MLQIEPGEVLRGVRLIYLSDLVKKGQMNSIPNQLMLFYVISGAHF